MTVQKDHNGTVTVDIPSITQKFSSSNGSPNADPSRPFPAFFYDFTDGNRPARYSVAYPPLPADYPLGGYIDTVADNIPAGLRPTGGLPIAFTVGSAVTPGLTYTGFIDNQGRIQFAASENVPVSVGTFATLPAHVSYTVGPLAGRHGEELPDIERPIKRREVEPE